MHLSAAAAASVLRRTGHEIESEVRGASMRPTFAAGSRIRIQCGSDTYARGEIVVILADPPIVHRVVSHGRCRSRTFVITRGDASWFCDTPVTDDQILGRVTAYQDGVTWRLPPPLPPGAARTRALARLSLAAVRLALAIDDRLANLVARVGAAVSWRCGHRG